MTRATLARPLPPADMVEDGCILRPARDLHDFIRSAFIEPGAPFWREEFAHLETARIAVRWTNVYKEKGMMPWAAGCEAFFPRGDAWSKAFQEQIAREWYGGWWDDTDEESGMPALPDFVLTFSGPAAAQTSDVGFCRTVHHELRHCGCKREDDGETPKYGGDGRPKFRLYDHEVSAFVSEMEDFGMDPHGFEAAFVAAAQRAPRFSGAAVAGICGTCLRAVA